LDVRARFGLVAGGLFLIAIGALVALSPQISFNLGNRCTVDMGCRDVSGSVSYTVVGVASVVAGLIVATYGLRKREDD